MVPKQEDSQKVRDLRDIQSTLKKIQKEYEAPQKGEGELQGLWWGLTQTNTARDFATLGMNEMMRAHNVRQAFEKEQQENRSQKKKQHSLIHIKIFKQSRSNRIKTWGLKLVPRFKKCCHLWCKCKRKV